MKKTVIIILAAALLCALLALGAFTACTSKMSIPQERQEAEELKTQKVETHEEQEREEQEKQADKKQKEQEHEEQEEQEREVREKQEFSSAAYKAAKEEVSKIVSGEPGDDSVPLSDIPVYSEGDLLSVHSYFRLLFDQRRDSMLDTAETAAGMYTCYPGAAVRRLEDGRTYFVYDTDTEYRLFALLDTKWATRVLPAGYYVIVKDAHSYSDFAELKIGDGFEAVEEIDSVAGIYRKYLEGMRTPLDKISTEIMNEEGYPVTSVHYLTDGLLLIEYLANDDNELYVNNIRYCEDYRVTNPEGETVNYKLDDIDLPYNAVP